MPGVSGLLGWGRMVDDLCSFAGSVSRGFAIPCGFLAPASHPLSRLPPVVILAFRPRLSTPRWRLWAAGFSRWLVGCFRIRCVVTVASGDRLVPVFLGWRPSLSCCSPLPPCVPVVGVLSSTLLPALLRLRVLSHTRGSVTLCPFPLRVLRSRVGFMVPSATPGTRAVGFPGVRHTASPYAVQLQCASIAADQVSGLAHLRLLVPLHAPI